MRTVIQGVKGGAGMAKAKQLTFSSKQKAPFGSVQTILPYHMHKLTQFVLVLHLRRLNNFVVQRGGKNCTSVFQQFAHFTMSEGGGGGAGCAVKVVAVQ